MKTIKSILFISLGTLIGMFLLFSCDSVSGGKTEYTLTTTASPPEGGTIIPENGKYSDGETIELMGNPTSNGWRFIRWEGDLNTTSNPVNLGMTRDYNVIGIFERRDYPLNITIEGDGTVEERVVSQPKITDYPYETVVELTPVPSEGWYFSEWNGDLNENEVPEMITVDGEKNVTVVFSRSVKTFGGSGEDYGNSIIQTSDGGYLFTGRTNSNDGDFSGLNKGGSDIFVMKLNGSGVIQWNRTFGGSASDNGMSITQTSDGEYVITGGTRSNDGDFSGLYKGGSDIFVMKLNGSGDIQWNRIFGGRSGVELGYSITQTSDGGYVLTGISNSNDGDFSGLNKGGFDIFVIKLNNAGEL